MVRSQILEPEASQPMPLWAWGNVLAFDAVGVGLLWQAFMTLAFCDRFPTLLECTVLGLSIWVFYLTDRLLDSRTLDCSRRRTLRHDFYRRHHQRFLWIGIVCAILDFLIIARFASSSQLRWGSAAMGAGCLYAAVVQLANAAQIWFPKELHAGLVFGFGLSLPAWIERGFHSELAIATGMIGVLCAANCIVVAVRELPLDHAQGFQSWLTRYPAASKWLPYFLSLQAVLCVACLFAGLLSTAVALCIVAADGLLAMASRCTPLRSERDDRNERGMIETVHFSSLSADASLAIPAALGIVYYMVSLK